MIFAVVFEGFVCVFFWGGALFADNVRNKQGTSLLLQENFPRYFF